MTKKVVICESVKDKYVFHEYRQKGVNDDTFSIGDIEKLKDVLEKDFSGKDVLFIMITSMRNPFNFDKEVVEHGKAH